jgi:hypothetical protein
MSDVCVSLLGGSNSMAQKSAGRTCARAPNPRLRGRGRHATSGERWCCEREQSRDDGARALRAVFSSYDNWINLGEAERDEWRGYFDRMIEWLRHLGYTPERNPWSMLLEA